MKLFKRAFALFKADDKVIQDIKTANRLSRLQAANMMRCSVSTLNTYASAERGPKSYKDTQGIYYKSNEVEAYIAGRYSTRRKRVAK